MGYRPLHSSQIHQETMLFSIQILQSKHNFACLRLVKSPVSKSAAAYKFLRQQRGNYQLLQHRERHPDICKVLSLTFQRFPHSKQRTKVVIGSSALRVCSCVYVVFRLPHFAHLNSAVSVPWFLATCASRMLSLAHSWRNFFISSLAISYT